MIELLAENGLQRGGNGLRIIMMCEIRPMRLLADQFWNISTASRLAPTT